MSVVRLTYCNPMHAGASWAETFSSLKRHVPTVKSKLGDDEMFGVALGVPAGALPQLSQEPALGEFRQWLDDNDLVLFTANGTSFGHFDGSPLKDRAFIPDWQSAARLNYTAGLAQVLSKLLPESVRGTISTLPLSYRPWFHSPEDIDAANWSAAANLVRLARYLWQIEQTSGRHIQLGLTAGPGGLLATSDDVVRFFRAYLLPMAFSILRRRHPFKQIEQLVRRHIGVCFDVAHASMQYCAPRWELRTLDAAGIAIAKVQATAALTLTWDEAPRSVTFDQLRALADGAYLHPVGERRPNGDIVSFNDLEDALSAGPGAGGAEWRIDFPVPVFSRSYARLRTTRAETTDALVYCRERELCDQFEIESSTWSALPRYRAVDIDESILRELQWVLPHLRGAERSRWLGQVPTNGRHDTRGSARR